MDDNDLPESLINLKCPICNEIMYDDSYRHWTGQRYVLCKLKMKCNWTTSHSFMLSGTEEEILNMYKVIKNE